MPRERSRPASDAGVDPVADRVSVDLSSEIDRDGGVDRNQTVVARGVRGVVGVVARMGLDGIVAVDPVVELATSERKGRYDLALVQRFHAPREHARLVGVHHTVGDHLRVGKG